MSQLRSILFYITVIDFSLLPMFHVYDIPFKIGFFIVGFCGVFKFYKNPCRPLFIIFYGLILSCWIGALYQHIFFYTPSYYFTLFCTTSYLLCFLSFCFGYHYSPDNFDLIFGIAIVVIFLNLIVGVFNDRIPFLIEYYNLQGPLGKGTMEIRNAGIFENPNISALGINILLLFITIANILKLFHKDRIFVSLITFAIAFVAMLSLISKNQLIAFTVLMVFYIAYLCFNMTKKHALTITFAAIIIVSIFNYSTGNLVKKDVLRNGIYTATNLSREIYDQYFSPDINMNIYTDRRVKYLLAMKAFTFSPLLGSGFDRAESGIFSKNSKIGYHSDWSYLIVAGGVIGVVFFTLLLMRVWKAHPLLILPFFFPGLTNSFMLSVQLFSLYGIFWGVIERKRNEKLMWLNFVKETSGGIIMEDENLKPENRSSGSTLRPANV